MPLYTQAGITALTGDITATGPGSAASTLATVNSNVGSFTAANITVNAKGLITAAANGSAAGTAGKKLGYDHTTASLLAMAANDLHAVRVYASGNATLVSLGVFISANAGGKNFVMGIYSDNGSSAPGSLLAQTVQQTTAVPTGATADGGYKAFDLGSSVSITKGAPYWLAIHSSSSFSVENAFNSATTGSQKYRTVAYSATMPSSFGTVTGDAGAGISMGGF